MPKMETSTCLEVELLRRGPSLEEGSVTQLIHHLDPSSVLVLQKLEGPCLAPVVLALDSRRMPVLVLPVPSMAIQPLPRSSSRTLPSPRLCPAPAPPGEVHHPMPLRIQRPFPAQPGDLLHSKTQEATREVRATDIAKTPSKVEQLVRHPASPTRFLQPKVPPQSPTTTSHKPSSLLQLPTRQGQTVMRRAQL